jgi:hypothetical protein
MCTHDRPRPSTASPQRCSNPGCLRHSSTSGLGWMACPAQPWGVRGRGGHRLLQQLGDPTGAPQLGLQLRDASAGEDRLGRGPWRVKPGSRPLFDEALAAPVIDRLITGLKATGELRRGRISSGRRLRRRRCLAPPIGCRAHRRFQTAVVHFSLKFRIDVALSEVNLDLVGRVGRHRQSSPSHRLA